MKDWRDSIPFLICGTTQCLYCSRSSLDPWRPSCSVRHNNNGVEIDDFCILLDILTIISISKNKLKDNNLFTISSMTLWLSVGLDVDFLCYCCLKCFNIF